MDKRPTKHTCSHSVFDLIMYPNTKRGKINKMIVVEIDSEFEVKLDRIILILANNMFSRQIKTEKLVFYLQGTIK